MPQRIDVPGHGIVEFPDGMSDDQIVAAIRQNSPAQTAAPESPAAAPYSLGPISDVAEVGARGINAAAQMLPDSIRPAPRAPQPMGQPVNLPFIGKPSAVDMGKAIYESGKSAATLPGDVYAGKVDPLSPEGIKRSIDMAAVAQLPTAPLRATRAATEALAGPEIKSAATTVYDAVRDQTRATPVQSPYLAAIADDVRGFVNQVGPRAKVAPEAHAAINDIAKGADLGDMIDSRKALSTIVREGEGENIAAAKLAMNRLDTSIERIAPGTVSALRDADKNYAIAMNAAKREQQLKDAITQAETAGSGGNVGNKIRQAFRPMLEKGNGEKLSPEVRAAVDNTVKPGLGVEALRPLQIFDPTQKVGLGLLGGSLGTTLPLALPGFASRAMYDRILKNRAAKISEAIRAEAPATLGQPGYQPGGILALPSPRLPQPTGILPLLSDRQ